MVLAISVLVAVAVVRWANAGVPVSIALGSAVFLALVGAYAGRLLRFATMARWAAVHTFGSLRMLLPLVTRALPLLLLAVTFLFINAEVWQVAALMTRPVLWAAVLAFGGLATLFLLVRLPDEVRRVEAQVDADHLPTMLRCTPAEGLVVDHAADIPVLPRFARANLVLVLLFAQAVQVLLLGMLLAVFFMAFGELTIPDSTVEAWTGREVRPLPTIGAWFPVSNDLFQVSVFLASFAGLYFTVYAVTDETYRAQFFSSFSDELERAIAVHAVYSGVPAESGDVGGAGSL